MLSSKALVLLQGVGQAIPSANDEFSSVPPWTQALVDFHLSAFFRDRICLFKKKKTNKLIPGCQNLVFWRMFGAGKMTRVFRTSFKRPER